MTVSSSATPVTDSSKKGRRRNDAAVRFRKDSIIVKRLCTGYRTGSFPGIVKNPLDRRPSLQLPLKPRTSARHPGGSEGNRTLSQY